MANSINHKHIVGGLHISYNIERAFPDTSHSNIVDSECIFGLFDKNNQTIIEASAENGYAYIPNMQLYDGYSYHNIHTYVSYNIHRLRVDLSDHKDASDNVHNSINTFLNASYNWLRKYVLDAYTYSYNSYNNLYTYVLTTYTNLINAYTNLKDYTTTNIGRLDGKIDGLLETKDALVFRGTIHTFDSYIGDDFLPENLTWNEIETNKEFGLRCGATFKVENDGWFFDKLVHAGDLIISTSDSASKMSKEGWTIIEQHIDRISVNEHLPSTLNPWEDRIRPYDSSFPDQAVVIGISSVYMGGITYYTYEVSNFFGDFGENDDIKHQISDTPTSYAKLLTGMTFKNGKLTYSYSTFYVDAVNKAEMSEYAKLSDLSEFARGAYGLTKLIGNSDAGNKVVTNLYLQTGTGYLNYSYTQLSASKNAGSNHDLKGGAITVVTGISQGGNGKITYHYQQISNSYNHHENSGASGTANQSITNINISNTGKLTYVYRDLSTTTGAATSATATNVISNEIKVLTGLSQTSDGKITYTYTPIKGTHNHTKSQITDFAHNHTKSEITDFDHTHTKSQITDFAHNHASANITDGIKVGTGITSSASTYTQGKAVYEFVNTNYQPKQIWYSLTPYIYENSTIYHLYTKIGIFEVGIDYVLRIRIYEDVNYASFGEYILRINYYSGYGKCLTLSQSSSSTRNLEVYITSSFEIWVRSDIEWTSSIEFLIEKNTNNKTSIYTSGWQTSKTLDNILATCINNGSVRISPDGTVTTNANTASQKNSFTADIFKGSLQGHATSATTATNTDNIEVDATSNNANYYLTFVNGTDGNRKPYVNSSITVNPSTDTINTNISGNATTASSASKLGNWIDTIYTVKADNSDYPTLQLICDITPIYNLSSGGGHYGFVGSFIHSRTGGVMREGAGNLIARIGYSWTSRVLKTEDPYIVPCIISYNSKYYIALKLSGSGHGYQLYGYFINKLSEIIELKYTGATTLPSGVTMIEEGTVLTPSLDGHTHTAKATADNTTNRVSVATAAHTHSTSSSGGHTPAGTVTLSGTETDGVLTITATFAGTAVEGHTHTANATANNTTNRVSVATAAHTHTTN